MVTNIPITILPIEEDGFHLMIEVEINGKPANLIVDTGASRTVFDQELIKSFLPEQFDEFEQNQKLSTGLGTNTMQSQAFMLDTFKIGELDIKDYHGIVIDLVHINQSYSKLNLPTIHGVLGGDILLKYKGVIYYKTKNLKLYY